MITHKQPMVVCAVSDLEHGRAKLTCSKFIRNQNGILS
jgi:hypothetical protein